MKCPYCGAGNTAGAPSCRACGERFDGAQERPAYYSSPGEYILDNSSYGETEPYSSSPRRAEYSFSSAPGRRSAHGGSPRGGRGFGISYTVVSLLGAALAVLQFLLPAAEWVAFRYQIFGHELAQGGLSLFDLCRKFLTEDNIVTFMTGIGKDFSLSGYLPDSVNTKFAEGRIAAIVLLSVFAFSLVLYFVFIFLSIIRSRAAIAAGIVASIMNVAGSVAVIYAVNMINSNVEKYDVFSWKNIQFSLGQAPYLSIALSSAIAVFCMVSAVLRTLSRRARE